MATWIAHLRIAEKLLYYFDFPAESFLVGNIGPDSGVDDGNGGWEPPKPITHWFDENRDIQPESFYDTYLQTSNSQTNREAFLLGYYAHLVSDVEWIMNIWRPFKQSHPDVMARMQSDPDVVWEIKKDWYGLDFLYLDQNPENVFQTTFQTIESVPDYLEYLAPSALTQAVARIKAYYAQQDELERSRQHHYPYLQQEQMDSWIGETAEKIREMLLEKGFNPRSV